MGKQELENLAKIGQLKPEPPTRVEFSEMINGAKKRLADAQNEGRIFAKSHNERNLAEYEGRTEVGERLLAELIRYTIELQKAVSALKPPPK